ncbi:hypothetical protein DV702_11300 [Sporosarcina sp. PTS2304]|uniref:LURP-one-related/scramblase family protein n=1 Tax=Sporosarcina sp. PTS2304 TaxID=2283194 RepID=UPI000E0DB2F9|nr:LURP-one-related family protein [Sporosarcina sp. PTS2304]AXI00257.1 hypothetical protein DV702_11300 [Sporosarcina sp. PTS2304]
MRELYMKQRMMSLRGNFTVRDADERDVYFAQGSFMQIPKTFLVADSNQKEVAFITKKPFSMLPTFFVEVDGMERLTIKKEFTFLKARYSIFGAGVEIEGNWWDMNFEVMRNGELIGRVDKKWFSWGDSYRLQIVKEEDEILFVSLVIAIDYVKASQAAASAGAT